MDNVTDIRQARWAKKDQEVFKTFHSLAEIYGQLDGSIAPIGRAFEPDKFIHESVRNFLELGSELGDLAKGVWSIHFLSNLDRAFIGRDRRDDDPTGSEVYAVFASESKPANMSERMVGVKPVEVLIAYSQTYPEVNNAYMMLPVCDALVEYWDRGFVVMDYDLKAFGRRALFLTMGHRELGEVTLTFYYNILVEDNRVLERLDKEDASDDE